MGARYQALLAGTPGVALPTASTPDAENVYWVFPLVLDDAVPADAKAVMQALAAKGVGTRPFFWPMHEQPVFRRMGLFDGVVLPVSERLARRGFYIPCGMALGDAQIDAAAAAVRETMETLCR
jgi:perosamine synthetase